MHSRQLIILWLQFFLVAFARTLPKTASEGPPYTLNPRANFLGPIVSLTPVPNTDTTVTFTKIVAKAPGNVTQADTLCCITESLAQIYQAIETKGATAKPGALKLSGTQPQNADCLKLNDIDPGDGKVLVYGVVAEALQGVALQLSQDVPPSSHEPPVPFEAGAASVSDILRFRQLRAHGHTIVSSRTKLDDRNRD
ncbi:MAG: hypothetical protein L6R40_000933 [Gallowayella cf. fulva]|nr:MAG: hypothetical protein L6R40_000933 [Xanthomendoza cf. fulva]